MKDPDDRKILPLLFANLQRTLEPNFTYSTLERVGCIYNVLNHAWIVLLVLLAVFESGLVALLL